MSRVIEGLEGVVATATRISRVDGQAGTLVIAGYAVEELAPRATFEEVVYLLLHGRLPTEQELDDLKQQVAMRRAIGPATMDLLRAAARANTPVMDALRMATATLSLDAESGDRTRVTMAIDRDSEDRDTAPNAEVATALRLISAFPTIVGSYWRLREGLEPVPVRRDLGHVASFYHQLFGSEPAPEWVRGLETYVNTVADHGLNASTFAARVIISTRSDLISAITGAVGALKGPLHGGAPGPALDMVREIGDVSRAEGVLREKLSRGERLMGFGHRVYRVRDPRADVLAAAAERFYARDGDQALYRLAREVETIALRLLAEFKPDRRLATNVEFYTALLLHGLGLPTELFTPIFAIGRVAGWTAHCLEQLREGRLIRPESVYVGMEGRRFAPA